MYVQILVHVHVYITQYINYVVQIHVLVLFSSGIFLSLCSVLDVFLSEASYSDSESDGFLEVALCKSSEIALHPAYLNRVVVTVSVMTVDSAVNSGRPLPDIPEDNVYSPNRAGKSIMMWCNAKLSLEQHILFFFVGK